MTISGKSICGSMTVPKVVVLVYILFVLGCHSQTNLHVKEYMRDAVERQKTLVIFLPGYGGSMDDLQH